MYNFKHYLLTCCLTLSSIAFLVTEVKAQQGNPQIKIDNNTVSADPVSGLKLPSWLKAGQTLMADNDVYAISVLEFTVNGTSLDFSDVKSVSAQETVPAGKVWKIESIHFEKSSSSAAYWGIQGNGNTTAGTHFVGTTDAQDVVFKSNNLEAIRLQVGGNVGIGTNNPTAKLEVGGQIKITGGAPGANKILVSDANGLASWKDFATAGAPTGSGTTNYLAKWTPNGTALGNSMIFDNGSSAGIGTGTPHASAVLDITSTTKGFAMPRMTTAQRLAIAAPVEGLQVYDTQLKGYYYYNGSKWDCVAMSAGSVIHFAVNSAPLGYLPCNGQAVSRTQYPELFATIGTTYGAGNGSTTFNLPDLRGEFIRGADNGRGVDPGRAVSTFQNFDWKGFSMTNTGQNTSSYSHGPVYMGKSTSSFIGNLFTGYWNGPAAAIGAMWDASEIRPRNIALLPCIKY